MNLKIPTTAEAILMGLAMLGVVAFFHSQDLVLGGWKTLLTLLGAILGHRFFQLVFGKSPWASAVTPAERAAYIVALALVIHAFVTGIASGL